MKKQIIDLAPMKDEIRTKLIEKYDSTIYMNTDTIDVRIDIKALLDTYMADRNITEPTIYITSDAYIKMRHLVDKTATEIGWYGTVTALENATYLIDDIIVYPQLVTGATCEQDEDKMLEFELSLTNDQVNRRRFQGHSHVSMGVTPSGVDENFYKDLLTQVNDYFIILVTNKRNEYYVRFYDKANNIVYTDIPINLLLPNGEQLNDWYDDVQDKLSTHKPAFNVNSTASGSVLTSSSKYVPNYNRRHYYEDDYDDEDWSKWYDSVHRTVSTIKNDKKKGKK